MSFDLMAISAARKLGRSDAQAVYEAICAGRSEVGLPADDENVDAFYSELTAIWPTLTSLDEDAADDSPWAADLERSAVYVLANIALPAAGETKVAFLAMAMRHGLYAYDPQSATLYDPADPADRNAWVTAEEDLDRRVDVAVRAAEWRAKGGLRLAREVLRALVVPGLENVHPLDTEGLVFGFNVNQDVEGRVSISAYTGGPARQFRVDACVGAVHLRVQDILRTIDRELAGRLFMVMKRVANADGRHNWRLDADHIDEGVVADMIASLRAAVAWAASLTDLDALLREMKLGNAPPSSVELLPVALALAGRQDEAFKAIERRARRAFNEKEPSDERARDTAFVERFYEQFDPTYRRRQDRLSPT
jgi:hypothetical protein